MPETKKGRKRRTLTVSLSPAMALLLEQQAQDQARTLSGMVRYIVVEHLRSNGLIKDGKEGASDGVSDR